MRSWPRKYPYKPRLSAGEPARGRHHARLVIWGRGHVNQKNSSRGRRRAARFLRGRSWPGRKPAGAPGFRDPGRTDTAARRATLSLCRHQHVVRRLSRRRRALRQSRPTASASSTGWSRSASATSAFSAGPRPRRCENSITPATSATAAPTRSRRCSRARFRARRNGTAGHARGHLSRPISGNGRAA